MPTQQQEFSTALAGLTPTQRAAYTSANPTIGVGGIQQNYNAGTATYSPVSSLSSGSGATTIDNAITDHNKDMTGLAGAPKTTTTTPAATTSVNDTIKAQGGLSVDEVNASGMDVTNYNYDPKTKYFIPKTADQTPSALAYENDKKTINDAFASHVSAMDAATSSLISSIQGIYSSRIAAQADANKRELATYDTMNTRFGTSRYAPGVAAGVLTADERVGLDRIAKIAAEEAGLIAQAQQSLTDKKYSAFVQQRNELNALRTERVGVLNKLAEKAAAEQKVQKDRADESAREQAIIGEMNKGITDPKQILANLNAGGAKYTSKDVKTVLENISPMGNLDKLSAESRDFFLLKQAGGKALPASITALPEDQQLMAYITMRANAARKPTGTTPTSTNTLTPQEANKYGMPPEMIGMNEKEILISLQNEEPPQWFIDMLKQKSGGAESAVSSPSMNFSLWDQFRREVLSKVQPADKAKTDNHTKATDYYIQTYGDAITPEQADALGARVALYVQGGMSYKDAVAKVTSEASQ